VDDKKAFGIEMISGKRKKRSFFAGMNVFFLLAVKALKKNFKNEGLSMRKHLKSFLLQKNFKGKVFLFPRTPAILRINICDAAWIQFCLVFALGRLTMKNKENN